MKNSTLKIIKLISLCSLLGILGAGCNGGSSSKLVGITNPTPNPTATSSTTPVPPINVCPAWGCDGPEPVQTFPPVVINPIPPIHVCPAWGCDGPVEEPISGGFNLSSEGNTPAESVGADTRDTDLQQANLQSATLADRAQTLSAQFQMSLGAATQLAVLGDKVQLMTSQGQELSDEDRDAITQSALSIAGISSDEVNQAFQKSMTGDSSATDALVEKAATNLGMPSSQNLRGQLLQALGVQLQ